MGKVAQPLRVAITGTQVSPDISHTVYLAGRGEALRRIDAALARIPAESTAPRHHDPSMTRHACIDPKHHVHDAPHSCAAVERACEERGLRLTPIRASVLGLIADAGKP